MGRVCGRVVEIGVLTPCTAGQSGKHARLEVLAPDVEEYIGLKGENGAFTDLQAPALLSYSNRSVCWDYKAALGFPCQAICQILWTFSGQGLHCA